MDFDNETTSKLNALLGLALLRAQRDDRTGALDYLRRAMRGGYGTIQAGYFNDWWIDPPKVPGLEVLRPLRGDPEFETLVAPLGEHYVERKRIFR